MKTDSGFSRIVKEFEKIWITKNLDHGIDWDMEGVWCNIREEIDEESRITHIKKLKPRYTNDNRRGSTGMKWMIRFAAVFLIAALTSLFTILYMVEPEQEEMKIFSEVVTERGQRATINLDDGSRIRLNSGSKLLYPEEFDSEQRYVQLYGEAYFEIAGDERPFIVKADEAVIEILGTEFNVYAYEDREDIKVVVAEGMVSVRSDRASYEHSASLGKGDMATLKRGSEGDLNVTQNVNLRRHLGWMQYRLNFDNIPLSQVASTLQRWYGVDIEFENDQLRDKTLTADFEDATIHEVIRVIEIAINVEHEMKGRKITLK
ncbi:MAG: FecR domain-containing protein [Balneolaceae bacterium]|nr:FecR domain-containing protein [Balneolaceae bacterium]